MVARAPHGSGGEEQLKQKVTMPDVLADRYASAAMVAIWSPAGKVELERELWIAVMKAQHALGVSVPLEAIDAYTRVKAQVDLASIRRRERRLRHDVKARIEEFCALAGYEHIHKGLTSRDLTENVEQLQIHRSLHLLRAKYAAALCRLAERAREYRNLVLTARTHNVPAQATTLGKRLAMFGEEMLCAFAVLEDLLDRYPLRGIKGAIGTQLDQITLLGGVGQANLLEAEIVSQLGFERVLDAVGQVYPRSLDAEVVGVVHQLASGPSSFAKTLRLMTGFELASEGFREGQVGSSAMPHKMNARSCERVNGLNVVLRGYLDMVLSLAGDQWGEGDVSCSVVRRVALPGAMFAIDGLLDTFITILRELRVHPAVIAAEWKRELPFLASTTILMEAVKRGAARERAHEAIKEHTVAVALRRREESAHSDDLLGRLANDSRIGLSRHDLEAVLAADAGLCGAAVQQTDAFVERANAIADRVEGARSYEPPELL